MFDPMAELLHHLMCWVIAREYSLPSVHVAGDSWTGGAEALIGVSVKGMSVVEERSWKRNYYLPAIYISLNKF